MHSSSEIDRVYVEWLPRILAVTSREFASGRMPFPPQFTLDKLVENMSRRHAELVHKDAVGALTNEEISFLTMYVNGNMCRGPNVQIASMIAQIGRDLTKDISEKRSFLQNLHRMVLGHTADSDKDLDLFLDNYGELVLPGIGRYWDVIRMDYDDVLRNDHPIQEHPIPDHPVPEHPILENQARQDYPRIVRSSTLSDHGSDYEGDDHEEDVEDEEDEEDVEDK